MFQAPNYSFTLDHHDHTAFIDITHDSTGRKKLFSVAGVRSETQVNNITEHIASLTEAQCNDWFKGIK